MTTYSLSDMATRVLRDLGIISAEETPSAEDLSFATETVSAEIASLSAMGIPIWNGSDVSVPIEYLTPLSRRLGLAVGPAFGVFGIAEAVQAMPVADHALRVMGTVQPTGAPQYADYY
jgi:hypothetical protein